MNLSTLAKSHCLTLCKDVAFHQLGIIVCTQTATFSEYLVIFSGDFFTMQRASSCTLQHTFFLLAGERPIGRMAFCNTRFFSVKGHPIRDSTEILAEY